MDCFDGKNQEKLQENAALYPVIVCHTERGMYENRIMPL